MLKAARTFSGALLTGMIASNSAKSHLKLPVSSSVSTAPVPIMIKSLPFT
jgi:hypothetical protein